MEALLFNKCAYNKENLTEMVKATRKFARLDLCCVTRPKFARQTKHQVFFSFRNIALHFIINEMLAG